MIMIQRKLKTKKNFVSQLQWVDYNSMGVPQVNPFTIFSSGLLLVLKVKGDEMISQLVQQKRCTGVEHGLQTGLPGTKKKVYRDSKTDPKANARNSCQDKEKTNGK